MARVNFILKRPGKGRKSFLILKRTITDTEVINEKVDSEAINAINQSYQNKLQDLTICEIQAKEVVKDLYKIEARKRPQFVHNEENFKLLDQYWAAEYEHRDLIDYQAAKNDLKRAIEAVGSLSLYSASREELQSVIAQKYSGNSQRRIASRLNQIFKFIKRDIKIRKDKKNYKDVKHLTLDEFRTILKFIDDPIIKLLHEVAFFTGCRIGEVFAIAPNHIKGSTLLVQSQLDRTGNRRETKNRIIRKAYVIPAGRDRVQEWSMISERLKFRNLRFSEITKSACVKAFPHDPTKWLVFHDLRHSYAIYLLSKGISLSLVAQSLGNSVIVCQQHYAGFSLTSDSIEAIESVLNKSIR